VTADRTATAIRVRLRPCASATGPHTLDPRMLPESATDVFSTLPALMTELTQHLSCQATGLTDEDDPRDQRLVARREAPVAANLQRDC